MVFLTIFQVSLRNWRFFWLMSFCFIIKKKYFKQKLLLWRQVPYRKVFYKMPSAPLGKIASRESPADVPPKDVLWMSPYGPLCNANGRPLPTSLGRWSMTSWGRPHTALYVTPLEVPYRHLEGVSCRRYEDVPYSLIYNSKRHVLRTSRGSPSETSWGSPKDALMWFYKQGWETSKR